MTEELSRWKRFKRYLKRNCTRDWAKHVTYQLFAFAISVFMVFGAANYAVTKSYDERTLRLPAGFTATAHQGAFDTQSDSVNFFKAAVNNNVDVIEIAVRQRPNGTLVMSSDIVVSNYEGFELSLVLEQVKDTDIGLDFNIKDMKTLNPLYDMLVEYGLVERSFLTGIWEYNLSAVKESNCANMPYYLELQPSRLKIFGDEYAQSIVDKIKEAGAVGVNCNYRYAGARLAETLHDNGYKLSVDSVNSEYNMKRILIAQPDNVITKQYDKLLLVISNWGS